MSNAARTQLMVYVDSDVRRQVRQIALDENTTASALVRRAIGDWLARRQPGEVVSVDRTPDVKE